ncbi:MAG: SUF system NifU family Fe-S cluster assembly protein [Gammaproteobacteria bacterium]|nr:SUF system NifU family Fe-S cluster assembly protein [Gammaproteobacteria bacterium]MCP5196541.1 SUF system NifU family Fe-S cluster assembly protein [Gammaproteobacteria bacterium]
MNDLRDLYQEVILDHNKRPRNFRIIPQPTHQANGLNPLCGDRISVYLDIEDGVIQDIAFQGAGCAISSASASLMTEALKGKPVADVDYLFEAFHGVVTTERECPNGLGKLSVLAGVRDYPSRVKCATLAWHAVRAALEERKEAVATE